MLRVSKAKIVMIICVATLLACTKSFNYSVLKSLISSWSFVDGGGLGSGGSFLVSGVANNELYIFYADPNLGIITANYQGFGSFWGFFPNYAIQTIPVTTGAPSVVPLNSKLYGIWTEVAKTGVNTGKTQNHVSVLSNGVWALVDPSDSCGAINCLASDTTQSSSNPVLVTSNSKLYSLWSETNAAAPNATQIKGAVYGGNDGSPSWSSTTPTSLNRDMAQNATLPVFAPLNSKLYALWSEMSAPVYPGPSTNSSIVVGGFSNVYVFFSDTANGGKGTVVSSYGTNWNTVSSADFTAGGTAYNSIALDNSGNVYVAYQDQANSNRITVMKNATDTNSWINVGMPGFSSINANYVSLAIDSSGTPYVAFEDSAFASKATVMKFSGGAWITIGSGISTGAAYSTSLAVDSSGNLFLGYEDGANSNKATVLEYTAGSWSTVGAAGFSAGAVQYVSMKVSPGNVPYIAYEDSANSGKATVQKYSGAWSVVGVAGFSAGQAYYTSLAFDLSSTPYIAFEDGANGDKASVMKFNGVTWGYLPAAGISAGAATDVSLGVDPVSLNPIVAYEDATLGGEVQVQEYNSSLLQFQSLNYLSSTQIRFAVYNGNDGSPAWQFIDGGSESGINFNKSQNATSPISAQYQGKLYLAWLESNGTANQVRVAVYGGNDAAPSGFLVDGNGANGLNFDSTKNVNSPLAFTVFFNQLYISWAELTSSGAYAIHVRVYNGNDSSPQWTFVDGNSTSGLNFNIADSGEWPNLTIFNNNLYSLWIETAGVPPSAGVVHAAIGN
jgi:hypothetical protein